MSSQTLLIPPSSLPLAPRRRPSLTPSMNGRPSPYPLTSASASGSSSGSSSSSTRPGMSRTYSFYASKGQDYAAASSSSKTSVPAVRRLRAPSPSHVPKRERLEAPPMERCISTLGIDGLQVTQVSDRASGASRSTCRDSTSAEEDESGIEVSIALASDCTSVDACQSQSSISVPCIIIDEPTPQKPAARQLPSYPYLHETGSDLNPGSPIWSNHSPSFTPGPGTPGTPFGLRQYNHTPMLVHSPYDSESDMGVVRRVQASIKATTAYDG